MNAPSIPGPLRVKFDHGRCAVLDESDRIVGYLSQRVAGSEQCLIQSDQLPCVETHVKAKVLRDAAENRALLEVGRKAVEDALIKWRDDRLSMLRNNGYVVKECDGSPSSIIRFGPEHGCRIALEAMAASIEGEVHA